MLLTLHMINPNIFNENSHRHNKIKRIRNKNLELISKVIQKEGRSAKIIELKCISNKWISEIEADKQHTIQCIEHSWGERHGFGSDFKCIVDFKKLQTSKNGFTPVLINKQKETRLYGEYELIDLFNWTDDNTKKTALFKLKHKLMSNSRGYQEFTEDILGYTVDKDEVGYYIIRNLHDFSDINYVTYFLPNDCRVSLEL